jgi:hypothetical protein
VRRLHCAFLLLLGVLAAGDARVTAQNGVPQTAFLPQTKLTTPAGASGFGAVALSGTTAVVGARGTLGPAGSFQGSAHVFVQNGATWSLQDNLTASDGAAGDTFGDGVAINGDTVVVGAPTKDVNGISHSGAAYVFVRTGSIWVEQQRLLPPTSSVQAQFGFNVAVEGNTAVVGAPFDGGPGPDFGRGAVYVYVRSGSQWSLQQRLLAPDGTGGDGFGVSVSLNGNTLVAGASVDTVGGRTQQGSAYVFVRSGTTWSFQQQLFAGDGQASDFFGTRVAISGDQALIGAPEHDPAGLSNAGAAYLFLRVGTAWALERKLTANDGRASDRFGQAVALRGITAVIGATIRDDGVAYVFRRESTGFTQRETLTPSDPTSRFGSSVALDGSIILVGAPEIGRRLGPGSAYPFQEQAVTTTLTPPTLSPANVTGSTVILNWTASTGASRYQLRAGTSPGSSNAFDGDMGNTTTVTAVNVANGSYFVRVHAVGANGESEPSNEVRVDVGVAAPCVVSAPTNFQSSVSGNLVTLTWNAVSGATSYIVEAGSTPGAANLANIDTNSAAPLLMATAPRGTYFVRIRAKRSCGISAPSTERTIVVN